MKYAVLTNDLQYDLVNKNEDRIAAVEAFTPKMVSFLNTMRENDVSIIHLQLINLEDDSKAERYGDFYQSQRDLKVQKSYLSFFMKKILLWRKIRIVVFETNLDETLKIRSRYNYYYGYANSNLRTNNCSRWIFPWL